MDRDQLIGRLIKQLVEHKHEYKHPLEVGIGQRSGSGARSLEPARGQKPTAEALKIQEVQEVDVGT